MAEKDNAERREPVIPELPVGSRVGRYKILGTIGKGPTGTVYGAENMCLGRAVALRLLPRGLMGKDEDKVTQFLRAAAAATRVDHPNIVPVYDVGREGDWCYVEMQKVQGRTLAELAATRLPLTVREATRIVRSVAEALQAAHEKSIIHRDIRPENLWITRDGRIMASGFGLAAALAEACPGATDSRGAALYAPPEQTEGKPPDFRGDIYSLGITLYYLLTGNHPFTGDSVAQIRQKHWQGAAAPAKTYNDKVPDTLCALIAKMTAKRPEDRHQNTAQLMNELDAIDGKAGHCLVRVLGADEIRMFWLSDLTATIGRDDVNTICLRDREVSNWHAAIEPAEQGYRLRDMKSRNGTEVNGERIEEKQIEAGDLIAIGASLLVFVDMGSRKGTPLRPGAYQFTAMQEGSAAQARPLRAGATLIGRHEANHLTLDGDSISNFHAQILVSGQGAVITDLKSRAGVRVNGQRVLHHELSVGDTICIGQCEFRFEKAEPAEARPARPAATLAKAAPAPVRPPTPEADATPPPLSPPEPAPPPPPPPRPAPAGPDAGVPLGSLCIPMLDSEDLQSVLEEEAKRIEKDAPKQGALSGAYQSSPLVTADLSSALAEEAARLGQGDEQAEEPPAPSVRERPLAVVCIAGSLTGQRWPIGAETIVLGRESGITITIPVPHVSRRHAEISAEGGKVVLKDLGSRSGTLVDGAKIKTRELAPGDVFEIGGAQFRVQFHEDRP